MKLIRKALWPTAIVAAALMLFGALGNAINADSLGNVQSSTGDNVVEANEGVAVWVEVSADATVATSAVTAALDAIDALAAAGEDVTGTTASVGAQRQRIVDAAKADLMNALPPAGVTLASPLTPRANEAEVTEDLSADPPVVGRLAIDLNFDGDTTDEGVTVQNVVDALAAAVKSRNGDLITAITDAPGAAASAGATTGDNVSERDALVANVVQVLKGITALVSEDDELDNARYTVEVDGNAEITHVLISATNLKEQSNGRSSVGGLTPVAIDADAAGSADLEAFDLTAGTSVLLVVVECNSGDFEVSFESDATGGLSESADFECQGRVAGADISASPSTVYLVGSAESVITVTIEDEDSTAATPGDDVEFTTNNACVFDNGRNTQTVQSEADGDETIAEATLDCSYATPGAVTVTAMIDKPGRDVLLTETVTVIGPPALLTVATVEMDMAGSEMDMDAVTCGAAVQLAITVVDSAGQPVADGTVVYLSTNVSGVLVEPSRTTGGAGTAYLITSNAHVGSYAVVAQSGVAHGKITVSCEAAEAAGVLAAPASEGAITPPSTGNAGLAETSGSSWMLVAIAGVLASVMVAVGKGLPSFFRR